LTPSHRPRCSSAIWISLAIVFAVSPATASPRSKKLASYKHTVDRGTEAFVAGNFDEAREAFEQAFAIHPNPVLVFNIASCWRRAGNTDQAVTEYRRFLELAAPHDPRRVLAEDTIASLEHPAAPEPEPAAPEATEPAPDPAPAAPVAAPAPAPAPKASRSRLRPIGIGFASVGGVGLIASVAELIHASTVDADPIAVTTVTPTTSTSNGNGKGHTTGGETTTVEGAPTGERDAATRRAIWFGIAGGALVATGVTMYFLGKRAERPLQLTVSASGDGGAVQLGGRF
jgi:hypothetical protein